MIHVDDVDEHGRGCGLWDDLVLVFLCPLALVTFTLVLRYEPVIKRYLETDLRQKSTNFFLLTNCHQKHPAWQNQTSAYQLEF